MEPEAAADGHTLGVDDGIKCMAVGGREHLGGLSLGPAAASVKRLACVRLGQHIQLPQHAEQTAQLPGKLLVRGR